MKTAYMHAASSETIIVYPYKAFHAKTTQEPRTRPKFPTSKADISVQPCLYR